LALENSKGPEVALQESSNTIVSGHESEARSNWSWDLGRLWCTDHIFGSLLNVIIFL